MIIRIILFPFKLLFKVFVGVLEKVLAYVIFSFIVIGAILYLLGVDVTSLTLDIITHMTASESTSVEINNTSSSEEINQTIQETEKSITDKLAEIIRKSVEEAIN